MSMLTVALTVLGFGSGVTVGAFVLGPTVYRRRLDRYRAELVKRFENAERLISDDPVRLAEQIAESIERHPSQYVFPDRGDPR